MSYIEKEKLIKADIASIENRVRHAFNQGYDLGFKDGKERAKPQEPKTGHCKDCKWWKDSDGKYRRGIGAESPCPINTLPVYQGEGYCYLFSSKAESEGKDDSTGHWTDAKAVFDWWIEEYKHNIKGQMTIEDIN